MQCGPSPAKGKKRGGKRKAKKPVKVRRVTFYVDLSQVVFYVEGDKVIVLNTDYNGKPRPGSYIVRRTKGENIRTEQIGGTP